MGKYTFFFASATLGFAQHFGLLFSAAISHLRFQMRNIQFFRLRDYNLFDCIFQACTLFLKFCKLGFMKIQFSHHIIFNNRFFSFLRRDFWSFKHNAHLFRDDDGLHKALITQLDQDVYYSPQHSFAFLFVLWCFLDDIIQIFFISIYLNRCSVFERVFIIELLYSDSLTELAFLIQIGFLNLLFLCFQNCRCVSTQASTSFIESEKTIKLFMTNRKNVR